MEKLFSFLFSVVISISIHAQAKPKYSKADKVIIQTFNDSLKAINKRIEALTKPVVVPQVVIDNTKFNIIYKQNFESISTGLYTRAQFTKDFQNGLYEWGLGDRTDVYDPKSVTIFQDVNSKIWRSSFPKGKVGANSGFCLEGDLKAKYDELYFSYNVRFKPGFNFVDGGKLSGLSGGNIVVPNPPNQDQGFVCVLMWRADGSIMSYVYHQAQTSQYGEGGQWKNAIIKPGEWLNITIRVVMNTPGKTDGIMEGWINGKLAFSSQHYMFRSKWETGIHKIEFHSFFGGDGDQYSAKQDEFIDYDNLTVFTFKEGVNVPRGFNLSNWNTLLLTPNN